MQVNVDNSHSMRVSYRIVICSDALGRRERSSSQRVHVRDHATPVRYNEIQNESECCQKGKEYALQNYFTTIDIPEA